jgi:hypothetical protein
MLVLESTNLEGVFDFPDTSIRSNGCWGPEGYERKGSSTSFPIGEGKKVLRSLFKQKPGSWGLTAQRILDVRFASELQLHGGLPDWDRLFVMTSKGWMRLLRFSKGPEYDSLKQRFPILP